MPFLNRDSINRGRKFVKSRQYLLTAKSPYIINVFSHNSFTFADSKQQQSLTSYVEIFDQVTPA